MDRYVRMVEEWAQEADIFAFDCFVVTIKTNGRWYGNISDQFRKRYPSIAFPDVVYGTSKGPFPLPDGRAVIFSCLWSDEEKGLGYDPRVITGCTGSAIRIAGAAGFDEVALPLIGGGQKYRMKPYMGQGIEEGFKALKRQKKDPDDLDVIVAILPKQK